MMALFGQSALTVIALLFFQFLLYFLFHLDVRRQGLLATHSSHCELHPATSTMMVFKLLLSGMWSPSSEKGYFLITVIKQSQQRQFKGEKVYLGLCYCGQDTFCHDGRWDIRQGRVVTGAESRWWGWGLDCKARRPLA